MNWLSNLSHRERLLIFVLAGLAAAFAFWQLALSPMVSAHNAARADQERALSERDIVRRAVPMLGQNTGTAKNRFDRSALISAAQSRGLAISRLQSSGDGPVQIWFDDARAADVFALLQTLDRDYAVIITRADFTRREGGFISAQITLSSGP